MKTWQRKPGRDRCEKQQNAEDPWLRWVTNSYNRRLSAETRGSYSIGRLTAALTAFGVVYKNGTGVTRPATFVTLRSQLNH